MVDTIDVLSGCGLAILPAVDLLSLIMASEGDTLRFRTVTHGHTTLYDPYTDSQDDQTQPGKRNELACPRDRQTARPLVSCDVYRATGRQTVMGQWPG